MDLDYQFKFYFDAKWWCLRRVNVSEGLTVCLPASCIFRRGRKRKSLEQNIQSVLEKLEIHLTLPVHGLVKGATSHFGKYGFSYPWVQQTLNSAISYSTSLGFNKPYIHQSWIRISLNFTTLGFNILFQTQFVLLFLRNSHVTKEIPDCGNLVTPYWVGNLRWDNTEPYEPYRWINTEPSVRFRKANTDPSVQFRKVNTDPSMQFRWGHTEILFCKMLGK